MVLTMWLKVLAFYSVLAVISYRSWHYLPKPLPLDAPDSVFSEARAKEHIVALADTIGGRQVGTYGLKQASVYLLDQLQQIKTLAEKTRGDDLEVEVEVQTVSGSYHLDLFMTPVYLSYSGLENLLLRIIPKEKSLEKSSAGSLLVNAHFDSAIGSPGAADCASCTAIAVETARAIVADKALELKTPIVILLNGGEETYMNAVHGFVTQHEWARSISHFVNIESTGSYGPDVVFRSNSHLLLSPYLASSQSPRANVVFQDIFDLGLMPAETDYAVLAHNSTSTEAPDAPRYIGSEAKTTVYGDLEGIDIASMFDSRSYHTRLDETKRMPPGVTQNFGDNILALVKEASNMMHDSTGDVDAAADGEEETAVKDSVYFDVLALFVVAYPFSLGKLLHCLPFLITLVAMSLVRLQSNIPLLGGIVTFMFSFVGSIAFSAAAFASIALYVKPMSWYGRPHIAALIFIPASLTGMLLPYVFAYSQPSTLEKIRSKSQKLGQVLIGHVLGSCFILSGLGVYTTYGGLRHSGYLFGFWVICSLSALAYKCLYLQNKKPKKVTSSKKKQLVNGKPSDYSSQSKEEWFDVVDTLIIHLPAAIVCGHMGLFGILFFQDRVSTMGSSMDWHGRAHCDLIVAIVSGALFFICVGPLVPFFGYHTAANWSRSLSSSKAKKVGRFSTMFKCIGILVVTSLACIGLAVSLIQTQVSSNSFTAENPKRIFVQRLNVLQSAATSDRSGAVSHDMDIEQSRFTLLGVDSIPLQNVLMELNCEGECTKTLARPPPKDHLLPAYPITRFMKDSVSVVVDSFERDPLEVAMLPSLQTRQELLPEKSMRRCHIKMQTPHAGYFVVNVTGSAVDRFSFTKDDVEPLIPSETLAGPGGNEDEESAGSGTPMYIFKHVANAIDGQEKYEWNWWIDIASSSQESEEVVVPITWAVSNITMTPALNQLVEKLPDYVNPIPINTYLHKFSC